ncbi:MAG: GDYXXLXY domain-containing protein [Alphaproteobacteria bacterium]|nr:GDYXXLXY domain-containing protein [Alphaproteobacteria bacterium SS10]
MTATDTQAIAAKREANDHEQDDTPWFVKAWIGLGAWITTMFGIGTGLALMHLLDLRDYGWPIAILGLASLVGGLVIGPGKASIFREQASLLLCLSGQGLAAAGAVIGIENGLGALPVCLAVTALLVAKHPSAALAFLSTIMTGIAAAVALEELQAPYGFDVLMVLTIVAGGWAMLSQRDKPVRIAAAASLLLMVPAGALMLSVDGGQLNDLVIQYGRAEPFAGWPTKLAWMGMAWLALARMKPALTQQQLWSVMAAVFALMILGPLTTAAALGLMILAYVVVSRGLLIIAALLEVVAIARFYYSLDQTLLVKSVILAVIGVIALIAWFDLFAKPRAVERASLDPMRPAAIGALVGLALVGVVATQAVTSREHVIATGKTVLLPLAPIDPRSIIQGDYMTLLLQQDILPPQDIEPRIGSIELDIDADGVVLARSEQASNGAVNLDRARGAVDRITLRYHPQRGGFGRGGRVEYGIDSFFFQEGLAPLYQTGRFAVLKVAEDGSAVLIGLANENKQLITPN